MNISAGSQYETIQNKLHPQNNWFYDVFESHLVMRTGAMHISDDVEAFNTWPILLMLRTLVSPS